VSYLYYDAVYLWALSVDEVMRNNASASDGLLVMRSAVQHVFQGITHGRILLRCRYKVLR